MDCNGSPEDVEQMDWPLLFHGFTETLVFLAAVSDRDTAKKPITARRDGNNLNCPTRAVSTPGAISHLSVDLLNVNFVPTFAKRG
jgi:hypothetical protein